jgi:signal recognition particle GTPase
MAFKWFKKKTAPGSEPEGRSEDDHQTPEQRVAEQAGQEAPAPPDIEPTDDPTVDHLPPAAEPDLPPEIATDTPEQPPLSEMSDPPADTIADEPIKKKTGLFSRLKKGLSKTREILTTDIDELFGSKHRIDDDMLEELEELLITSDIGVQTAMDLMENITKRASKISNPEELKAALKAHVLALLEDLPSRPPREEIKPRVIMVVGVNGVGKTTTIGKLAAKATARGERVLIAAADTFRAAAIEQLAIWAERAGADLVKHKANADPAAVAFDAMEAAVARGIDTVFVVEHFGLWGARCRGRWPTAFPRHQTKEWSACWVKNGKYSDTGVGGVGTYLAKRLVHEGYAVTAIEPDSKLIRHIDGYLDARLIQGSAMSIDCWREANAENIDVLIAVTDNDAVNMLASMIADRFGIPFKIARVRSMDFDRKDPVLNADDLKIDLVIHPGRAGRPGNCPAGQADGRQ